MKNIFIIILASLILSVFLLQWLNNCVGRKNYITFVSLMAASLVWVSFSTVWFLYIMFWCLSIQNKFISHDVFACVSQLIVECGVGIAVFVRCFVDKNGMKSEITERLGVGFSQPPFATVVVSFLPYNFMAFNSLVWILSDTERTSQIYNVCRPCARLSPFLPFFLWESYSFST